MTLHVFYCLRCNCGWVSRVIEFMCPLCKKTDLFVGLVRWE